MVSKNILAAVVVIVILAIGGAHYLTQQPSRPTLPVTPTFTPTPTATPTPTETPTPTQTATPTPTVSDEDIIRKMVQGYYDAFNRHSVKDEVAFFTEDATKMLNHGRDGTWKGTAQITQQLTGVFKPPTDIALINQTITKLDISGDKATVQVKYKGRSTDWKSDNMTENMELVKVGGIWKIAKTDIIY